MRDAQRQQPITQLLQVPAHRAERPYLLVGPSPGSVDENAGHDDRFVDVEPASLGHQRFHVFLRSKTEGPPRLLGLDNLLRALPVAGYGKPVVLQRSAGQAPRLGRPPRKESTSDGPSER